MKDKRRVQKARGRTRRVWRDEEMSRETRERERG